MLLNFIMENYRSFYNETVFSMSASSQRDIEYSVQKSTVAGKKYKGLSSAVIYGPNASGKTTIIGAMEVLKTIVLRGNINNSDDLVSPNHSSTSLELIPCYNMPEKPTKLGIKFIDNEMVFEYLLSIKLGKFLENNYERKIVEESLFVNEKQVFFRSENDISVSVPKTIKGFFAEETIKEPQTAIGLAKNSLVDTELFLTNGFKSIFSKKLVGRFTDWIDNKFMVIYHCDAVKTIHKFTNPRSNAIYIERTLTDVAREFGVNSNALGYKTSEENTEPMLCSLLEDNEDKKGIAINAELFESYGTIRFINEFPLVIKALLTGATLVMDEFDASIHPIALMNIIKIFHNDEINVNHAQLVFNTHNPIFLSADLFRRDEIKFVERDERNLSVHYSLSDFKTNGEVSVRSGEDYLNNYFVNRYGAIKEVDFAPIVEKIIEANRSKEEQNA